MTYSILAPHIDDECIGCFDYLKSKDVEKVYYFFETESRIQEAYNAAEYFDFSSEVIKLEDINKIPSDTILLVPNISDKHIDHKAVNIAAKKIKNTKIYYSVDMNIAEPYSLWEKKKECLYNLYPSQKQYFDLNPQCYLFEMYMDEDYSSTLTIPLQTDKKFIELTLAPYAQLDIIEIQNIIKELYLPVMDSRDLIEAIFTSKIFFECINSIKVSITDLKTNIMSTSKFTL